MKPINARIMTLTLAAVLASVLTVGTISFLSLRRTSDSYSTEIMRLICDERRETVNDYLRTVENAQRVVSKFASDELGFTYIFMCGLKGVDGWGPPASQRGENEVWRAELDEYLSSYVKRVEKIFHSAIDNVDGVSAYYFRINPEISETAPGFFYSRAAQNVFHKNELTDFSLYDPDDMGHVGWYYTPLRRGEASWLGPYVNENLNERVISFVAPLYKLDTFIGVIGIDVSIDTLVDMIRDIRLYESDYAFLADRDGTIIYHPTLPSGYLPEEYVPGLSEGFVLMSTQDSNTEPVRYTLGGVKRQLFFATIASGQKLVVTAPLSEIDAAWTMLAPKLLAALLGVLLIFAAVASFTVYRITQPLRRLRAAAQSIAEGDYSVRLDYHGNDEVGLLTQAFEQLVERLRVYINDLNSMAYRDVLTGVKNKAAYNISAQKLNDMIRMSGADGQPRFALAMFDCNDLKKINDTYGHDKGDVYLQTACKLICDVFMHCPVFRLGGDEFAALLTDDSYDTRDELLLRFASRAAELNAAANGPWEKVNVARGVAAYEPGRDADVEQVLRRADALMYEDKRSRKAKLAL